MVEAKSKTIGDFTVTITTLTAMRSLKLMHRLLKAVGPGLLRSIAGVQGEATSIGNLNVASLADGVQAVLDRVSEDDLEHVIKTVFDNATLEKSGKTQPFLSSYEMAYAGQLPALLNTIRFGLEANYGNFFDALRNAAGANAG